MQPHILFVDDEPNQLRAMARVVYDQGWRTHLAADAGQAEELLARYPIDAAILDVRLPGRDGFELLRRIKTHPVASEIEVIMLTGLKDPALKRRALRLGAADLAVKPIHKEDLVARIGNLLAAKARRDRLRERARQLEDRVAALQGTELVHLLGAGLVHDLNNILSTICGYSALFDYLEEGCDRPAGSPAAGAPRVGQYLGIIQKAAERATGLLTQILDLSRQARPERTRVHLGPLIDECLAMLRPRIPAGVQVEWGGAPAGVRPVWGVESQLHQVLLNLCLNAIQSLGGAAADMPAGVIRIGLDELRWNAQETAQYPETALVERACHCLHLTVADSGPGMTAEIRAHVFDPFYTRGKAGGTGLGLAVARQIVQMHEGEITVESEPGRGACFHVYLPCADQSEMEPSP